MKEYIYLSVVSKLGPADATKRFEEKAGLAGFYTTKDIKVWKNSEGEWVATGSVGS